MWGWNMKLLAELIVETKDKKIVQEANSLLIQFFQLLKRHLNRGSVAAVKQIDGNVHSGYSSDYTFAVNAPAGNSNYGIVVGSGTTAVDICNDYALENKLDLDYSAVTVESTTCESGIIEIAIKRDITNNTGADVTINEVALYCFGTGDTRIHCIDRTILVEPVTLQNEQTVKMTYKLKYVA